MVVPHVQHGGLEGRSHVFSIVDYRKAPGVQDAELERRSI